MPFMLSIIITLLHLDQDIKVHALLFLKLEKVIILLSVGVLRVENMTVYCIKILERYGCNTPKKPHHSKVENSIDIGDATLFGYRDI
ncbi:hypothetical protein BSPWISOXPB_1308 [uncultured Gammaproteobacteria bacterium]|nr:hypothetical protein BSPWISOXPB_1308 [uncultured Gammaproteobacteria bacterium]